MCNFKKHLAPAYSEQMCFDIRGWGKLVLAFPKAPSKIPVPKFREDSGSSPTLIPTQSGDVLNSSARERCPLQVDTGHVHGTGLSS